MLEVASFMNWTLVDYLFFLIFSNPKPEMDVLLILVN